MILFKIDQKYVHYIQHGSCIYHAYTKFYQNSSICSEDTEEEQILHQLRAITLLFMNEYSPFAIPNHSSLISMSMQSLKKISQKLLKLESGNDILHQSRAMALLFIHEFSPFAIPNHSSPILMSMQSLKKIGQKLLKLESANKALTDQQTDTKNFKIFSGYNIIPRHFLCGGV